MTSHLFMNIDEFGVLAVFEFKVFSLYWGFHFIKYC